MKITEIDRTNLRMLAGEMQKALEPLAEKYGLKIKYRGGNYTAQNAVLKFETAIPNAEGVAQSRERQDFIKYAEMYGLKAGDIDQVFLCQAKRFKVAGLLTKSRSLPIVGIEVSTGKGYKFSPESVKVGLTLANPTPYAPHNDNP